MKGAKIEIEVTSVDKFHVVADLLKVYFRHSQAPSASNMDEDMPETKGKRRRTSKQTKTEGMFVDGDFCADDGGCCGSNEGECCGASACDTPKDSAADKKDEKEGNVAANGWSWEFRYIVRPILFAMFILQLMMYFKLKGEPDKNYEL